MKNLLMVLGLVLVVTFAVNAQSKDCCSKSKGETTKKENCNHNEQTMKACDKVETTTTTTSKDGKETVNKEVVVTKVDKKEKCGENSSCCNVKKEVEKKEIKKD
jgi:hypothetical protein